MKVYKPLRVNASQAFTENCAIISSVQKTSLNITNAIVEIALKTRIQKMTLNVCANQVIRALYAKSPFVINFATIMATVFRPLMPSQLIVNV
jgi:hypothetical protein